MDIFIFHLWNISSTLSTPPMGRQLTRFLGCPFQVAGHRRSDGQRPFFIFRFLRYFHVTLLYPWHVKLNWLLFHLSNIFYSTNGWTADLSLSTGRSEKKWWTLSLFHIQISQIPLARPPLMTPLMGFLCDPIQSMSGHKSDAAAHSKSSKGDLWKWKVMWNGNGLNSKKGALIGIKGLS